MQIYLEEIQNIKIIRIEGTVDMFSAKELRDFFLSLEINPNDRFILDLDHIHHIDSSGIAALINFNTILQKAGIQLRVLMNKKHLQLLLYFQLDKSMTLHYSLEAAINSFL